MISSPTEVVKRLNEKSAQRSSSPSLDKTLSVQIVVLEGPLSPGWFLRFTEDTYEASLDSPDTPDIVVSLDPESALKLVNSELHVDEVLQSGRAKFSGDVQRAKTIVPGARQRPNSPPEEE